MAFLKTSEEAYDLIGGLFTWVFQRPEFLEKLSKLNMVMKLVLHDPRAVFVLDCKNGSLRWSKGELETPSDFEVGMSAETAHKLWLNKINLLAAVSLREIIAKGSVTRVLGFGWALRPLSEQYARILTDKGRRDLLE